MRVSVGRPVPRLSNVQTYDRGHSIAHMFILNINISILRKNITYLWKQNLEEMESVMKE